MLLCAAQCRGVLHSSPLHWVVLQDSPNCAAADILRMVEILVAGGLDVMAELWDEDLCDEIEQHGENCESPAASFSWSGDHYEGDRGVAALATARGLDGVAAFLLKGSGPAL